MDFLSHPYVKDEVPWDVLVSFYRGICIFKIFPYLFMTSHFSTSFVMEARHFI